MAYKPIHIDRKNLTIMGVQFPDLETLNRVANAMGSNMFEGFEPTKEWVQLLLDSITGKIGNADFINALKKTGV